MKKEPKSRSGLKAVGVVALLASLLLFAPAVSAASYSMIIESMPEPALAEVGDWVEFHYTLENTGDVALYNVKIEETVGNQPVNVVEVGNLAVGEVKEATTTYQVSEADLELINGYNHLFCDSWGIGENSRGRMMVKSGAFCCIVVS